MMFDWLIPFTARYEEPPDDATMGLLADTAEQFLRSGLSPEAWSAMSPAGRAAFVVAGDRIRLEQAQLIAAFVRDPKTAAANMDPQAGRDAEEAEYLLAAADRVQERLGVRSIMPDPVPVVMGAPPVFARREAGS